MNRSKVRKPMVSRGISVGQKNISSFFSQNSKDLPLPSFKNVVPGFDPQIKDAKSSAFRPTSPMKKGTNLDSENLCPPSPDLHFVPETPNSQVRLRQSPRTDGGLQSMVELSPVRRSPRKKDLKVMMEEERANRQKGFIGSLKRLLSPPEESRNTKRSNAVSLFSPNGLIRTENNLNVDRAGTCTEHNTSKHQSQANAELCHESRSAIMPERSVCHQFVEESHNHQDVDDSPGFTVITNQKTPEIKTRGIQHANLYEDNVTARVHEVSDAPVPAALHRGTDPVENATTPVTVKEEDRGSSEEQRAGGNSETVCEDQLDESWFTDQWDLNEGPQPEKIPRKPCKVPDHVILSGGPNNRYWVLDVDDRPGSKTLTITCFKSLHPTETCLMKGGWEMTPVCRGDVVHLEGSSNGGSWLVDRDQGFLILHPDSLVSGTSISSSIRCMRRAVLGDMFKSFDGGSRQMLNGTMVHEVFQRAATANDFSLENLTTFADEALHSPKYLGDMYSLGVSQEEMKLELYNYLPSLELWAKEYLSSATPKTISLKIPSSSGAPSRGQDPAAVVTVTELTDIEENVWSPRFGLKGKIDVTARVRIQRSRSRREEKSVPLELKTGKESNSIEHRSQVILYTLMSLERYNTDAGFLLYLKTGNMHPVAAGHMDRRELLKLRNTLVHYIHHCVKKEAEQSHLCRLPDILTDRQTCRYCPQIRNCSLYERALDPSCEDVAPDVIGEILQEDTGHLTPSHFSYFSHWLLLCCLEAATMETKNSRRRVWLQTVAESEKNGSCVGNLQLSGSVDVQTDRSFLHRFVRRETESTKGLSDIGLTRGDRVVVSDQEGRLVGLATGYLYEVCKMSVSCTLDRDLSKFSGVLFRLDGDEGVVGLSTHLNNISRLMENCQNSDHLRELVVDLCPPEFITNLSSVLPREAKDTVAEILKGLNKPQRQAMKKVLLSKDYTLIVGMPGTGKTTTICTVVRILHACGFSVLLTSYTHSAVDNILLKLKRFQVGFLRLGQGQKVHPDIRPYTEESVRKRVHTLSELEQLYNKELVVATTCMGIKHPIFSHRQFDFCIVDEASQISQPICLGPLFYAKKFVLVGDHQQLPPIVQNQEARSRGMDESLFKRLECHGDAVVQLNVQYRMNRQIMSLSNVLMYDGRLECGSERTATALLTLPSLSSVQTELSSFSQTHLQSDMSWMQTALLPSNPVCFLDCSKVPALESVEQGGISNYTEAALIQTLLSLLIKAGCKPSDIGVIAPYRQQLKCLSALLQASVFTGVEVNTVDKYQGRDKSVIVFSFVRSTAETGHLGELLKDWRRLNVAVTRAKHKLLMVGSASTLQRYAPVEKLLNHLQQENMIIQLPPAAHKALPSMHL
ncbi:DNA replication ATP-dependent helicase/nuclease DNA2 isoform X2 [Gouania willdenowi]|uniref:DNA replication ATP-dependent helicase/nuclease DNA2 isoform X2 n=1 Tax=Gouania willdenowi TaxID=441366 RepID=UPI001055D2CA|nr:DNA replication ATP-dependent helicase/nuclease DNA2 isoform X2 [Gouania willdenowi]